MKALIIFTLFFSFVNSSFAGRESGGGGYLGLDSSCISNPFETEFGQALLFEGTPVKLLDECGLDTGKTGVIVGLSYDARLGNMYLIQVPGFDELIMLNAYQVRTN